MRVFCSSLYLSDGKIFLLQTLIYFTSQVCWTLLPSVCTSNHVTFGVKIVRKGTKNVFHVLGISETEDGSYFIQPGSIQGQASSNLV